MPLTPAPPSLIFDNEVIRYLVAHYVNGADGTPPDIWDLTLYDYDCAIARATELMIAAGYTGICTITQVTATYVYAK